MFVAAALSISFVAIACVVLVKVHEHRQDVLYGPYLKQREGME
jgi:hypothetical protein